MYSRLFNIKAAVSVGNSPLIVLIFLCKFLVERTKDFFTIPNRTVMKVLAMLFYCNIKLSSALMIITIITY